MEGLNRIISTVKTSGNINRVIMIDVFSLTCLIFVDDVPIFIDDSIRDIKKIMHIIAILCKAIGMVPN